MRVLDCKANLAVAAQIVAQVNESQLGGHSITH